MSSAAAAKAKRGGVVLSLQGPGPGKRRRVAVVDGGGPRATAGPPVVVYEHTPKVIHARPDEFKALVQRLTGRAGGGGGGQEATVLRPVAAAAPSLQRTGGGGGAVIAADGWRRRRPPGAHAWAPAAGAGPGGAAYW
jgi:MAP kinase substrate 1